jgi:hypothetical protein
MDELIERERDLFGGGGGGGRWVVVMLMGIEANV